MPTTDAVAALRADRTALLEICAGLGDADWKADSGCAGWSVQDVVAHMGALYWLVVDPTQRPDTGGVGTEAGEELVVQSRRSWSAERVVDDYTDVSAKAIDALTGLVEQDFELPLGDLGTYHASQLALPYAFDHYTHIRADLFAPRGPLTDDEPASDELRLGAALDWVAAAVGQINETRLGELDGSVDLHVVGTAARTISVGRGPTVADVTSDGPTLIRWITQRGSWADLGVSSSGDDAALDVIRSLKVF
jgi:uncharacterized protein (TIGR03083 family)